MVNKLSIKKRLFLYTIFFSLLGGFFFYTYLLISKKSNLYYIDFKTSVQGLKNGCSVNYNGLNIGVVEQIELNEDNDDIRVTIKVDYNFNIYADYAPTVSMEGLASVSVIELSRDPELNHIKLKPGSVLVGNPSYIESLKKNFGNTLDDFTKVVYLVKEFCSKEDLEKVRSILVNLDKSMYNIQKITSDLSTNDEKVKVILNETDTFISFLNNLVDRAEKRKSYFWKWLFGSK